MYCAVCSVHKYCGSHCDTVALKFRSRKLISLFPFLPVWSWKTTTEQFGGGGIFFGSKPSHTNRSMKVGGGLALMRVGGGGIKILGFHVERNGMAYLTPPIRDPLRSLGGRIINPLLVEVVLSACESKTTPHKAIPTRYQWPRSGNTNQLGLGAHVHCKARQ